ncbi:MAG: C4-type zinc ribbon domain-containing protein [Bacteroidia bacterium]|nr:C4-type zinc ribbon domain-containing protein [Bacteroidia bacterium]MDW8334156.1 C4-type zinc ribbon domain-containing protein [Bacteroidia bacterium]
MDLLVHQRLQALSQLQKIHSRLDRIIQIRGGLPEEVRDLEDELEGLETRIERLQQEIEQFRRDIADCNVAISVAKDNIVKFNAQLDNVRNQREHEAVSKEIEVAELEILAAERKIRKHNEAIQEREAKIAEVRRAYAERRHDLDEKRRELEQIMEETAIEEATLRARIQEAEANIEPRMLYAYRRIRQNMRNGLAVVTMYKGACGGCFAMIPPQRQYEVRQRRQIIVCENCGRILADEEYFAEAQNQEAAVS